MIQYLPEDRAEDIADLRENSTNESLSKFAIKRSIRSTQCLGCARTERKNYKTNEPRFKRYLYDSLRRISLCPAPLMCPIPRRHSLSRCPALKCRVRRIIHALRNRARRHDLNSAAEGLAQIPDVSEVDRSRRSTPKPMKPLGDGCRSFLRELGLRLRRFEMC